MKFVMSPVKREYKIKLIIRSIKKAEPPILSEEDLK